MQNGKIHLFTAIFLYLYDENNLQTNRKNKKAQNVKHNSTQMLDV